MVPYQTARPTPEARITPSAEFLDARGDESGKGGWSYKGSQSTCHSSPRNGCGSQSPKPALPHQETPDFHSQDRAKATLTAELAGSSCRAAPPLRQSRHWALQSAKACPITAASAATPPPSWLQISFSLKMPVSLHAATLSRKSPHPPLNPSAPLAPLHLFPGTPHQPSHRSAPIRVCLKRFRARSTHL